MSSAVSEARAEDSPEFIEYENIVVTPFSDSRGESIPDWRTLYFKKIAQYEAYLKKYPDSPLAAEAKLRIAELMKDVELQKIYPLRVKMYECIRAHRGETEELARERAACVKAFWAKTKKWRDPVYTKKAIQLLIELVEKHGHTKRYGMVKPHIGGFKWMEEEIGAQALYVLSQGAPPEDRKAILLIILREYKAGPKLFSDINADLEKLKNVKVR